MSHTTATKWETGHRIAITFAIVVAIALILLVWLDKERRTFWYILYTLVIPVWFLGERKRWPSDTDKEEAKLARELWVGIGLILAYLFGIRTE
jgi:hypothetical protein